MLYACRSETEFNCQGISLTQLHSGLVSTCWLVAVVWKARLFASFFCMHACISVKEKGEENSAEKHSEIIKRSYSVGMACYCVVLSSLASNGVKVRKQNCCFVLTGLHPPLTQCCIGINMSSELLNEAFSMFLPANGSTVHGSQRFNAMRRRRRGMGYWTSPCTTALGLVSSLPPLRLHAHAQLA